MQKLRRSEDFLNYLSPLRTSVSGEREPPSELELLCQAQAGCAESFGLLAERYKPTLLRYLGRRVARIEDAEDLAQETFARAFSHLSSFQPGRPFAAWLFTIAMRLTFKQYRSARPLTNLDESDVAMDDAATAEEAAIRAELHDNLWMIALRLLPPRDWRALWLRYGEEKTMREIARDLGINAIYVKVLLFRARRRLLASEEFTAAFGDDEESDS
jgi:RNA polymerase sigma-70 factor, ECF subfamily